MWESGGIGPPLNTSALEGSEWTASHPRCFNPVKRAPCTHWTRGWVGLGPGLEVMENGDKRQQHRRSVSTLNIGDIILKSVIWTTCKMVVHLT